MSTGARDTTEIRGLEKRKACDLCHIKKIKCDGRKPTCSHCVVYDSQCAYTPHIKRRRKEVQALQNAGTTRNSGRERFGIKMTSNNHDPSVPKRISYLTMPSTLNLPPAAQLRRVVHDYLIKFNIIVPLFDKNILTHLPTASNSSTDDALATYAAINVILALAFRHRATAAPPIAGFDVETCIFNAQVAAGRMISGRRDLLHLQVQLGLVILHLGMPHPERAAASVLIAGAVKLAHELSLHQSRANALFDADMALLRVRIFWIVYILDREISIRTSSPPLLREEDHNIAIPDVVQKGGGIMCFETESGAQVELDVFGAWISLARIQDAVYEQLYSIRSEAQPPDVRQRSGARIRDMLRGWMTAIPKELHADKLACITPNPAVAQLVTMQFSCLTCVLHTHQVGSHNAEWIGRLVDYSERIVAPDPFDPGPGLPSRQPPSSDWFEVVDTARECAMLFRVVDQEDSRLMWSPACSYVSATLVLTANILTVSEHGRESEADGDAQLVAEAVAFLARRAAQMPDWATLGNLHKACAELACRARVARFRFPLERPGSDPTPVSVAWLEAEARRSAGYSARALVEAFTTAEVKPLSTRLWRGNQFDHSTISG